MFSLASMTFTNSLAISVPVVVPVELCWAFSYLPLFNSSAATCCLPSLDGQCLGEGGNVKMCGCVDICSNCCLLKHAKGFATRDDRVQLE